MEFLLFNLLLLDYRSWNSWNQWNQFDFWVNWTRSGIFYSHFPISKYCMQGHLWHVHRKGVRFKILRGDARGIAPLPTVSPIKNTICTLLSHVCKLISTKQYVFWKFLAFFNVSKAYQLPFSGSGTLRMGAVHSLLNSSGCVRTRRIRARDAPDM